MARTRGGDCVAATSKVKWPLASALVRPASSIPSPSLRRTTSSPAAGLPVVDFLAGPVRVWRAKEREESRRRARIPNALSELGLETSKRGLWMDRAGMGSFDCARNALRALL